MTNIGNHSRITALPAERARIRKFYVDVLGAKHTRRSDEIDFFRFGNDFFLAVIYDAARALPVEQQEKSIWLELKAEDPAALTKKIRDFGVKELESLDKTRLYFQAPGGQVFRVAGSEEDLSRFES